MPLLLAAGIWALNPGLSLTPASSRQLALQRGWRCSRVRCDFSPAYDTTIRYAAADWARNLRTLPGSLILRRIRSPLVSNVVVTLIICALQHYVGLPALVPLPHTLLGSALGLLLVFRTNTAYNRFWEGRKIWEKVASISRDLSRMARLYEGDLGTEKLKRSLGLVAAFPYLLRQRVQPRWLLKKGDFGGGKDRFKQYRQSEDSDIGHNEGFEEEEEGEDGEVTAWVNTQKRPWRLLPKGTLESCIRSQNRPLWVCDRLGKEIVSIPDSPTFTSRER